MRTNLVAAGPLSTVAASNIEGFDALAEMWPRQAPLGWDMRDPEPVADAAVFLLSPLARGSPARSSTSTAASTPSARRCPRPIAEG